ncbi:hypothetical protein LO762_30495 [Actinocorallia sp. API 0066]|uniref:hypothetical protein n=1 Tax=Actinocorallia sp. API 0066 TaxID=2896846 RepID=UPI001E3C3026|nr:hypothetical protein [Actinocorallia sp. API 0066]MCD0453481.1 hypothetical protein [Actinocorallia sp. API 0066]
MSVLTGTPPPALRDGWLAALADLVPVADGYRDEVVGRGEALDLLRCGDALLDDLVAHGLPCSPDGRFDRYDLFNLALYSGSGRSAPETGIRFALRWMGREPDTWFTDKSWTISVELACPRAGGCGADPWWKAARPLPEAFGGTVHTLLPDDPGTADLDTPGFTARLTARGERRELRSPVLREICAEYDAARWVRLPVELQARPELVLPHGIAPCISVSLDLAAKCRAAGYRARTRRGWILGMLDLAHAWLEVVDDDGLTKVVDPVFGLLSAHADAPHPSFRAACSGSRFNRLLPSAHEADEPLFRHGCAGGEHTPKTRTTVRTARPDGPADHGKETP